MINPIKLQAMLIMQAGIHLERGQKIQAIKSFRLAFPDLSLKETKDFIDNFNEDFKNFEILTNNAYSFDIMRLLLADANTSLYK